MSKQTTSTTSTWMIFDYLMYGKLTISVGAAAIVFGFTSDDDAAMYAVIAGYVVVVIGGMILQVGLIAKAVQLGTSERPSAKTSGPAFR